MLGVTQCGVATLFLMTSLVGAAPFSKYGRSCKDIGCLSNEVCIMVEDPCTLSSQNQCGRYPTCKRSTDTGELSCTTMVCPSGQYCKTENGRPTCVNTVPGLEYDSAGVSSVNGHRTNTAEQQGSQSSSSNSNTNLNPYANANAPPPVPNQGNTYPVNSGSNSGYPAYPGGNNGGSSSGSNIGFNTNAGNGYPPYPTNTGSNQGSSSGGNLGYPPYPNQNRMPVPGQTNYPAQSGYPQQNGYPVYPQQNGYPQQPQQYPNGQRYPTGQYPGYQNYPGYPNTYQNRGTSYNSNTGSRRRNSGVSICPTASLMIVSLALVAKYFS